MELLSHPLIRYVVEVMFIVSLTAFLIGITVSACSFVARHLTPDRGAGWKRSEQIALSCWKFPK
jgi:hypothetical protein